MPPSYSTPQYATKLTNHPSNTQIRSWGNEHRSEDRRLSHSSQAEQSFGSLTRWTKLPTAMDINNTSVIKDPIAGSGLAASQDIGIGDVIIQLSSPYLLVVEKEALDKVCSFCLIEASPFKDAPPLKRCSACKVPRYCSSECHKKDWLAGHLKECPILKSLPDIPPTPVRALIQLLLQHQHGASLNPRWAALESHVENLKMNRKRWDDIVLQAQGAVAFSKSPQDRIELAIQVLCRVCTSFSTDIEIRADTCIDDHQCISCYASG
jgi:hypothetical protein